MLWKLMDRKGILNNVRTTDNYAFSDNLQRLLDEEFKKTQNEIESKDACLARIPEIDHSILISLRKYQFMILFLRSKIECKRYSIEDIMKDPAWIYSENLLKNEEQFLSYFGRFCSGDGIRALMNTIHSMILKEDPCVIARQLSNISGFIEKTMMELKQGSTFSNTLLNDYNRIATSSSFRRLQSKAQVFPLEEHDYARTRLTHSFEVSGIAREIANIVAFRRHWPKMKNDQVAFQFEKILECAALLHDMGNPPFGHYGEDAIKNYFRDEWDSLEIVDHGASIKDFESFGNVEIKKVKLAEIIDGHTWSEQAKNDFICFDGNAQALRVISKLQRYKNARSLELSACILGAVIKYPFNSVSGAKKMKLGYFLSEEDIIEKLKFLDVFKENYRNPLSMILEAADDISYITSDFDDAVNKNVITKEIFDIEIKNYYKAVDAGTVAKCKDIEDFVNNFEHFYKKSLDEGNREPFKYTILRMVNDLKKQLILSVASAFVNNIEYIMDGIHFNGQTSGDKPTELLDFDEIENKNLIKWIKSNLFVKYLYKDNDILSDELKGEVIIKTLLNEYTKAVLALDFNKDEKGNRNLGHNRVYKKKFFREEKIFGTISSNFVDVFYKEYDDDEDEAMKTYYKLRLVVDYVSGMTDSYALECYQNLMGIQ